MLGKKKIHAKDPGTSFDRLLNYTIKYDDDFNDQIKELADAILGNCPILINFEKLESQIKCNEVLYFLQGVIYAVGGECYPITAESFLIGSEKAFEDGSLNKWIKEFGQND